MSRKRAPGGPFPEGWEFFKPAFRACWFIRQIHPQKFTIFGVCPCKTPLDPRFDNRRRQLRELHEISQKSGKQTLSSDLSKTERTIRERRRETNDRYCGSWHPEDIPWCLGDFWSPGCNAAANIRAVVNLCATERYYDGEQFVANGIDYVWHKTEGGGHIPTLNDLLNVCDLFKQLEYKYATEIEATSIEEIWSLVCQQAIRLPVVLLHCTHGVNRTGFTMATMALLYDKNLKVDEAIEAFGQIRGHYINRPELEQALFHLFESQENKDGNDSLPFERGSGVVLFWRSWAMK